MRAVRDVLHVLCTSARHLSLLVKMVADSHNMPLQMELCGATETPRPTGPVLQTSDNMLVLEQTPAKTNIPTKICQKHLQYEFFAHYSSHGRDDNSDVHQNYQQLSTSQKVTGI